ncbi:hypothetical protein RCL1_000300 [Eukaryota sp. TZLM3-RCL]
MTHLSTCLSFGIDCVNTVKSSSSFNTPRVNTTTSFPFSTSLNNTPRVNNTIFTMWYTLLFLTSDLCIPFYNNNIQYNNWVRDLTEDGDIESNPGPPQVTKSNSIDTEWLNDATINSFFSTLQSDNVLFISPAVMVDFLNDWDVPLNHLNLDMNYICFIPVNDNTIGGGGTHWTLLIFVKFNNHKDFLYLDPLCYFSEQNFTSSTNYIVARTIVQRFGDVAPITPLFDYCRQQNNYDCGVFVCWFASIATEHYISNKQRFDLAKFIQLLNTSKLDAQNFRMTLRQLDVQNFTAIKPLSSSVIPDTTRTESVSLISNDTLQSEQFIDSTSLQNSESGFINQVCDVIQTTTTNSVSSETCSFIITDSIQSEMIKHKALSFKGESKVPVHFDFTKLLTLKAPQLKQLIILNNLGKTLPRNNKSQGISLLQTHFELNCSSHPLTVVADIKIPALPEKQLNAVPQRVKKIRKEKLQFVQLENSTPSVIELSAKTPVEINYNGCYLFLSIQSHNVTIETTTVNMIHTILCELVAPSNTTMSVLSRLVFTTLPHNIVDDIEFRQFSDERQLLKSFLEFVHTLHPQLIVGASLETIQLKLFVARYTSIIGELPKVDKPYTPTCPVQLMRHAKESLLPPYGQIDILSAVARNYTFQFGRGMTIINAVKWVLDSPNKPVDYPLNFESFQVLMNIRRLTEHFSKASVQQCLSLPPNKSIHVPLKNVLHQRPTIEQIPEVTSISKKQKIVDNGPLPIVYADEVLPVSNTLAINHQRIAQRILIFIEAWYQHEFATQMQQYSNECSKVTLTPLDGNFIEQCSWVIATLAPQVHKTLGPKDEIKPFVATSIVNLVMNSVPLVLKIDSEETSEKKLKEYYVHLSTILSSEEAKSVGNKIIKDSNKELRRLLGSFYILYHRPKYIDIPDVDSKNMNHIVSYLSTTIVTMYENNISQHFIEHVSRAWNVVFHKDVKVKSAPTTEAQQQIFDFCANIRDTILEGNGNSIKWTDIFQRPNLQQRLFISFAKSFNPGDNGIKSALNKPLLLIKWSMFLGNIVETYPTADGSKLSFYSIFYHMTDLVPGFVPIDTKDAIHHFVSDSVNKSNLKKDIPANANRVWNSILNLSAPEFKSYKKNYRFGNHIRTDGWSVSITFTRNDLIGKPISSKQFVSDEKYIDTLSSTEIDLLNTKRAVVGDPNKYDIVRMVSLKTEDELINPSLPIHSLKHRKERTAEFKHEKEFELSQHVHSMNSGRKTDKKKWKQFHYTSGCRKAQSRTVKFDKKINQLFMNFSNSKLTYAWPSNDFPVSIKTEATGQEMQDYFSNFSSKTVNVDRYNNWVQSFYIYSTYMEDLYHNPVYRKIKFLRKMYKTRAEDRMLNLFKATYGSPETSFIAIGDWEQRKHARFKPPTMGKGIRKLFRKAGYKVYLIDEYNTSKCCHHCVQSNDKHGINSSVTLTRNKKIIKNGQQRIEEVEESVWGLVRCCKCERYWDRDFNSALNLYQIVQCALEGEARPECLQRPKKEESEAQLAKEGKTRKRKAGNEDKPKKANKISDLVIGSQPLDGASETVEEIKRNMHPQ